MNQLAEPLPIRFVAEAYFYLMLQRCRKCGRGPLVPGVAHAEFIDAQPCRRINVSCRQCGESASVLFDVSRCPDAMESAPYSDASPRENSASDSDLHSSGAAPAAASAHPELEPSLIIDVSEWLTLFHMILRASNAQSDRAESRRLGFEAAQCLHEALHFYGDGDELPGREAFFSQDAFSRSRLHPEQFSRARLLGYREKLPSLGVMRTRLARDAQQPAAPRPWWKRLFG